MHSINQGQRQGVQRVFFYGPQANGGPKEAPKICRIGKHKIKGEKLRKENKKERKMKKKGKKKRRNKTISPTKEFKW